MSLIRLAYLNISRRKSQTLLIGLIVALTVMSFIILTSINYLVKEGIELSKERLGADMIVVPRDIDINLEGLLFTGAPNNSYMDKNIYDEIVLNKDVEEATPQFYTATIEGADCCGPDVSMRLVGINLETDFILSNWFLENQVDLLDVNEIIVGQEVPMFLGSSLSLLGEIFEVKGTLDYTGTGMDETIFLDINKARQLSKEKFKGDFLELNKYPDDLISTILIKIKNGSDINRLKKEILELDSNIRVGLLSTSIEDVKNQFNGIKNLVKYIIISFLVISFISLMSQYKNLVMNRKKEIGYLRGLGLSKYEIVKLLIYEILIISLIFGILASIIGGVLVNPIIIYLKNIMMFPSVELTSRILILKTFQALLFSMGIVSLASFGSIKKVYRISANKSMFEGGLY